MPTILITGVSGLVGSAIVPRLKPDYTVVGLDISQETDLDIEILDMDLTDDKSVRDVLKRIKESHGSEIASIIHLAAYYDFTGEDSPLYEKLTVEGTRRLLRELHKQQFNVEQFIFSSSLLVMEPDEKGRRISELSPTRAEWAYPESKLKAEEVISEERGNIPAVILRIAGVYDEYCHSLPISQQIARIYEKQLESYVFPGDASHGQALVHLEDLADCVRRAVDRRKELEPESLFLIAEPDVMSYAELQDQIGLLIYGEEWPTLRIPKFVAKAGAWVQGKLASDDSEKPFIKPWMIDLADDHYAAVINRARLKLGWDPAHRLRNTLPAMIEHLKADPEQFYKDNKLPVEELKS
jgi:nucleoside-diphosphate-sugar epimerase